MKLHANPPFAPGKSASFVRVVRPPMRPGPSQSLSPMRTAGPAARPPHAFFELSTQPLHMLSPCFGLFYGDGPADPFIARERRNVFPCDKCGLIGGKGFSQIRGDFVYDAARDCSFRHMLIAPGTLQKKSQEIKRSLGLGYQSILQIGAWRFQTPHAPIQ
jgi:hypothetical protein